MHDYLCPTPYFDFDTPLVQRWVEGVLEDTPAEPLAIAQALYLACRDEIAYNPYTYTTAAESFKASYALRNKESYCIPKAVLLGAAARSKGIPSRLGLGDVKNHLASPKLLELIRSDVFVMHGYIELFLEGKWVKATPAFNSALCTLMNVEPLAFNGRDDSIFQEFTHEGHKHMEYLKQHGTFADVPVDMIVQAVAEAYPHLRDGWLPRSSLQQDLSQSPTP